MGLLRFLAECRKRQLNQALSLLCNITGNLGVSVFRAQPLVWFRHPLLCSKPFLLNTEPSPTLPITTLTTGCVLSGVLLKLLLLCCRGNTPTPAESNTCPESHYELPSRMPSQSDEQHTYKSAASVTPEPPQPRDSEHYDSIDEYLTTC